LIQLNSTENQSGVKHAVDANCGSANILHGCTVIASFDHRRLTDWRLHLIICVKMYHGIRRLCISCSR